MEEDLLAKLHQLRKLQSDSKLYNKPNDNVLIIDGTNYFIRNWSVNPMKNSDGEFIGGAIGFLRSLGYLSGLIKPTRIIVAFDGKGGSKFRKSKFSDYKSGRAYNKKKTDYDDMNEVAIRENMLFQSSELIRFLKLLPIKIIIMDNIEADDVIAHLSTETFDGKVTIASSDNDFLQLIDERICIYTPTTKRIVCDQNFKDIYGFDSRNFIWYKCILGDNSDSVPNIKGVGKGSIPILYEFLNNEIYHNPNHFIEELNKYSITKDDVLDKTNLNKLKKIIRLINENLKLFELNFEIMQLKNVSISGDKKMILNQMMNEKVNKENIHEFRSNMLKYSAMFNYNSVEGWYNKNFSTLIRG